MMPSSQDSRRSLGRFLRAYCSHTHTVSRIITLFVCLLLPVVARAGSNAQEDAETVRVAAISVVPQQFDLHGNADRLEKAFRSAAAGGARLAVAPEGALEGYVVNEIIAGQEKAERMRSVAITIDDPLIRRFQKLAQELTLCMVFGFAERIDEDVYNCAVFIDHSGHICGKYHKMQLAEGYHARWWFNRLGKACRAIDTPLGRCGILICNDRWNPQLARIVGLDGAQFLVIPSYGSRATGQDEAVLSRGRELNVPVVEANVGVSLIVDQGQIAALDRQDEGITFAEITIPTAKERNVAERNRVQQEFLEWRKVEMQRRYEKTLEKRQAATARQSR